MAAMLVSLSRLQITRHGSCSLIWASIHFYADATLLHFFDATHKYKCKFSPGYSMMSCVLHKLSQSKKSGGKVHDTFPLILPLRVHQPLHLIFVDRITTVALHST